MQNHILLKNQFPQVMMNKKLKRQQSDHDKKQAFNFSINSSNVGPVQLGSINEKMSEDKIQNSHS